MTAPTIAKSPSTKAYVPNRMIGAPRVMSGQMIATSQNRVASTPRRANDHHGYARGYAIGNGNIAILSLTHRHGTGQPKAA